MHSVTKMLWGKLELAARFSPHLAARLLPIRAVLLKLAKALSKLKLAPPCKAVTLAAFLLLRLGSADGASSILLIGDDPGPWPKIFGAVGLSVNQASNMPPAVLARQVESGALVVLEGPSEYAEAFSIKAGTNRVSVRSLVDDHDPKLPIIWQKQIDLPVFTLPSSSRIFAKERWTGAPLMAGFRKGKGAVLWIASSPGEKGFERYPYLLQAVSDLGVSPALRSNRLWAFFDSSYRTRVDLDYFAERWRRAGISALHVAAWHYNEADPERDAYLRKLIEACHKRAILVYAWIELPHVSEAFWQSHPEWREKTALLQDAHLDWRKLMNLSNRDCFRAVAGSTKALLERFDWDGVNLAELYFESLEGIANASRFTPMNDEIRREYKELTGTDPLDLFKPGAAAETIQPFLQYRAGLARRMQSEWIGEFEKLRSERKDLDLVLTHVDDRFDTRMRDLIGADAAQVLPMLEHHDFTFLIEDPATIWHLGPERYPQIAAKYKPLTKRQDKLAIDINIVERYQDVYPTKQQTGTELFQLVRESSGAFDRVALYFENSIAKADLALLPAAAAYATRFEQSPEKVIVDSPNGIGVSWTGPALVNGKPWPIASADTVWLPKGAHVIQAGSLPSPIRIVDFNGQLGGVTSTARGIEISYSSSSRAIAVLDRTPSKVAVDGGSIAITGQLITLPRGQHIVSIETSPLPSQR